MSQMTGGCRPHACCLQCSCVTWGHDDAGVCSWCMQSLLATERCLAQTCLLAVWPIFYFALYVIFLSMSLYTLRKHSWDQFRGSGKLVRLQVTCPSPMAPSDLGTALSWQ